MMLAFKSYTGAMLAQLVALLLLGDGIAALQAHRFDEAHYLKPGAVRSLSRQQRRNSGDARKHPVSAAEAAALLEKQRKVPTVYQLSSSSNATWTTTPFDPTGIPLAVKSPYLSTWLWAGAHDRSSNLASQFASFWNGNTLPWCGTVMVDGQVYTWMGVPANCAPAGLAATQLSLSFTASQTVFVMEAGGVNLTATFLSPVLPNDLVRQTLPYSYLSVNLQSNDNATHTAALYTDVTGEWASNDWTRNLTWKTDTLNSSLLVHEFELLEPVTYGEASDSTLYGQVVYATEMSGNTTYQTGPSSTLRQAFVLNGRLNNTVDTNYRTIEDSQPGFAFSKDFGTIAAGSAQSALFAVGHYRDPAFSYTATNATYPDRSLYYMSAYPSLDSSLSFFYNDFETALSLSTAFDQQVRTDATSYVSSHYADLCSIVARQIWSGTEITIGKNSNGAGYNTSDIMIFMKEIATSNYVNTVDVMSPAWPFFAYANPDMLEWMLRPVIEYSEKYFPHAWAPHDIGTAYPNATGPNQLDAPYYIEESANMLFMALAYTRYSGKTDLIQNHYAIHKQWADFLGNSSLFPAEQASTDDFAGELTNMTSLAVKGAVGLGCMGALATLANQTEDATYYTTLAQQHANEIIVNAMASTNDHLKLTYNETDSSWSSLYNLLPDKVFQLGIFNDSFYEMQANWYGSQALPYGIPLDSRSDKVKTDFALWMAGVYDHNATLRDIFIEGAYDFLSYGQSGQAVPDLYDAANATAYAFVDRPVVGGIYANLALGKLQGGLRNATTGASGSSATAVSSSAKRRFVRYFKR